MGAKIEFDIPKCMSRFDPRFKRAQAWIDNEVLKDCDPYVPFRTGVLVKSGTLGTKIGSGKVEYIATYAKSCYYSLREFSKEKHPKACAQWFEKAKAVNVAKWKKGVEKILKG